MPVLLGGLGLAVVLQEENLMSTAAKLTVGLTTASLAHLHPGPGKLTSPDKTTYRSYRRHWWLGWGSKGWQRKHGCWKQRIHSQHHWAYIVSGSTGLGVHHGLSRGRRWGAGSWPILSLPRSGSKMGDWKGGRWTRASNDQNIARDGRHT